MKTEKNKNKNSGIKILSEGPLQRLSNEDYQFILELIDKIDDKKTRDDQIIKLIQLLTQTIVLMNRSIGGDL